MTAHDKHGNPVRKGDLVETVYGGDHHTFVVDDVSQDDHGHYHAHGSITIAVPVTATSRRKDENPKNAPREGSGELKAQRTPSHDTADALEKPEVTKKSAADQSPASRKGK